MSKTLETPSTTGSTTGSKAPSSKLRDAKNRTRKRLDNTVRRLTLPFRMLPQTLVIGAQKAGTTSLFQYIVQHPAVRMPARKEVRFFHAQYHKGMNWYRSRFPMLTSAAVQTLDASPGYLDHPHAPGRVAHHLPGTRIIVLLRDPVERAWSHYRHSVRIGVEDRSFAEALSAEEQRLEPLLLKMEEEPLHYPREWGFFSYRRRGRYAEHLERWFRYFGPERFLILTNEELSQRPAQTMARVWEHLGLPPHEAGHYPHLNKGQQQSPSDPASKTAWSKLRAYFEPHNRRLEQLLDRRLDW